MLTPIGVTVAAGVDETSARRGHRGRRGSSDRPGTSPRLTIPVVVLELLLGIAIGPRGFDIARVDPPPLSEIWFGMLFFFAGYEIDFERIRGVRSSLR